MTSKLLEQMASEFCRWWETAKKEPPYSNPEQIALSAWKVAIEIVGPKIAELNNNLERGIDDGLVRALGIVTSAPDQTAFGCAKAIRDEIERRRNNGY